MESMTMATHILDNGGRRRVRDRRFLVSVASGKERRTNWERRGGYDRRMKRITISREDRRITQSTPADQL